MLQNTNQKSLRTWKKSQSAYTTTDHCVLHQPTIKFKKVISDLLMLTQNTTYRSTTCQQAIHWYWQKNFSQILSEQNLPYMHHLPTNQTAKALAFVAFHIFSIRVLNAWGWTNDTTEPFRLYWNCRLWNCDTRSKKNSNLIDSIWIWSHVDEQAIITWTSIDYLQCWD